MGIRFACHVCNQPLNIKRELAGRRGICPGCASRIRIPVADAEKSEPVQGVAHSSGAEIGETSGSAIPAGESHAPAAPQPSGAPAAPQPSGAPAAPQPSGAPAKPQRHEDQDEAIWYVRPPSGGQYGPATGAVLAQWVDEGRVSATALLWREGWPQWRSAAEALPESVAKLSPAEGTATGRPGAEPEPTSQRLPNDTEPSRPEVVEELRSGPAPIERLQRKRAARRTRWILGLTLIAVVLIGALILILTN